MEQTFQGSRLVLLPPGYRPQRYISSPPCYLATGNRALSAWVGRDPQHSSSPHHPSQHLLFSSLPTEGNTVNETVPFQKVWLTPPFLLHRVTSMPSFLF
ncbi:hypothetical protein ATANTOWER_023283 [Ataeniobius toweri]|uniref:Uncharacterized protein n=1 Tax=Ataeniobius toweri TaxID=208326 RepID=A0ABU7A860_9TELE|nr:hypothetical protein [Ataeniobius toweri]